MDGLGLSGWMDGLGLPDEWYFSLDLSEATEAALLGPPPPLRPHRFIRAPGAARMHPMRQYGSEWVDGWVGPEWVDGWVGSEWVDGWLGSEWMG